MPLIRKQPGATKPPLMDCLAEFWLPTRNKSQQFQDANIAANKSKLHPAFGEAVETPDLQSWKRSGPCNQCVCYGLHMDFMPTHGKRRNFTENAGGRSSALKPFQEYLANAPASRSKRSQKPSSAVLDRTSASCRSCTQISNPRSAQYQNHCPRGPHPNQPNPSEK